MIHWAWLLEALSAGVIVGMFVERVLAAGRDQVFCRHVYPEGLRDGFKDDLEEFKKVG
jgi:hypothetical protein